MKQTNLFLFLLLTMNLLFSQTKNDNFLLWSSIRRLTVNDFVIKTKDLQTAPSFDQFSLTYEVRGFDFLTKNFNKKVNNYLIK